MNSSPSELHAPIDSRDTATNACVLEIVEYFVLLLAAARFAASPASVEVIVRCDVAQVSDTVTSQVRHLPHDQGISVTPSGRLPSSLVLPSALHMISLIILCRCCLPLLLLLLLSLLLLLL